MGTVHTIRAPWSPDGSTRPDPTRDADSDDDASTLPGSRLPRAWVGDNTERLAMLDLARPGGSR